MKKDIRDPDQYVENYKEAGWDNIYHEKGVLMVWNYFRTEMEKLAQNRRFSVIERQGLLYISDFFDKLEESLLTMLAICSAFYHRLLAFLWLGVNASSITTLGFRFPV